MANFKNTTVLGKVGLLTLMSLALCSCGDGEGDDLDQFIKNSGNGMVTSIKPLPSVKPSIVMQYNADGALVDPFKARKAANKVGSLQPNLNRAKEPLEAFPLDSIHFVGLLRDDKLTYALLKTPDNLIQQVRIGSYVGQNFGIVSNITDSELDLIEVVQDELLGDWVERKTSLTLQE